jgi:cation diffusion facilitator CzcD-associated flavoprotein CzcO
MQTEHVDVLVVGAGVSGIGAGVHLQRDCPNKSFAILETRDCLGGTWDLFRYPGIRSDSDMYTFGYSFKPWTDLRFIADGASILDYVREAAREHGVDRHIRYRHRARKASWSSTDARWTIEVEREPGEEPVQFTCNFLYMCAGYYDYSAGYTPDFAGVELFTGRIVHPQQWTDEIAFESKRVVVIGSGATAVTLIPELAERAAHVTMLQRSPTYMLSWPSKDRVARALRRVLPLRIASAISRWQYLLIITVFFQLSRRWPAMMKRWLIGRVRRELGPDYDVEAHFTPSYKPWDQRVCLVPDGNLFRTIRAGTTSVVTDRISHFTEKGIALESGDELEADLIVTATGLKLRMIGGMEIDVDGVRTEIAKSLQYKGFMFSGIPNLASCFGYTNASWTLKADLVSAYLCRLLRHMDAKGVRQCTPRLDDNEAATEPFVDFSSGYITRAADKFARQGSRWPWKLQQNYALDIALLRFGRIDDGTMQFSRSAPTSTPA